MHIGYSFELQKPYPEKNLAFTIVELLIVIVVIAILAAISVVAYNGIQSRAKNASLQSTMANLQKKIEAYNAENGNYPVTQTGTLNQVQSGSVVRVDSGCSTPAGANNDKRADWIPGMDISLPQTTNETGSRGDRGCYMYQSDGTSYILTAWNMVNGPQTTTMYRRLGFREINNQHYYLCNHPNIGASNPSPYNESRDYYKYSYTLSNIRSCNETPPAGA